MYYTRCHSKQYGSSRHTAKTYTAIIRHAQRFWLPLQFACLLLPGLVLAQSDNESILELTVNGQRVAGEWSVMLSNINGPLGLDTDLDGDITWDEIRNRRSDIERHLHDHLHVFANGIKTDLHFEELAYGTRSGEPSILSRFSGEARQDIQLIGIDNTLNGNGHRLQLQFSGVATLNTVLTPGGGVVNFGRETVRSGEFRRSVVSGILHIWEGYDHILFLLVLLIPAVFQPTPTGRKSVSHFGHLVKQVVIVVSAFTIAHSLTLTLAAVQLVHLPSRLVEIAIAVSVLFAALHNFLPKTTGIRSAWLACGFGLLHGFGFANFLGGAIEGNVPVLRTLVGFNVGVELGQLAIVAVFLPFAFLLRDTRFYRIGLLYGGSAAVCFISLFWIWGRAL